MAQANLKVALCWTVIALCGLIVPAHAIDAFFPSFGNDAIDVKQYDITLDVDPRTGRIAGNTALSIKALRRIGSFRSSWHRDCARSPSRGGFMCSSRKGNAVNLATGWTGFIPSRALPWM